MMDGGGIGTSSAESSALALNLSRTDSRNSDAGVQGDYGIAYSFGDKATLTDGGAIAKMGEIAMTSIKGQMDTQSAAMSSALKFAYDAGRPEASTLNKTLYVAGGVIALIMIAWVLKK